MLANEGHRPSRNLKALTPTLIAVLRADGHLCNVLTHVGRGNWRSIEDALELIFAPRSRARDLDPVARNVLALICDERGVTGPLMKAAVFALIGRTAAGQQTQQLKRKIMRLRRAVAVADLAEKAGHVPENAIEASHPGRPEQLSGADQAPASTRAAEDVGAPPLPVVEFESDGICVDATVIAGGLGLDPASVPLGMQRGEIKAICERGVGADDGLYRLTFLRSSYRVQLIVANDGNVRKRSTFAAGNASGGLQRRSAEARGGVP
jgi:hypothetical protein